MKQKLFRFGPVVVWMLMIFFFSSRSDLPSNGTESFDFFSKKFAHVLEYMVLTFLWFRAVGEKSTKKAILYSFIYACTDEIHQLFVPYRTSRIRDVGIDLIGISLASFIINKYKLWNSILFPPTSKTPEA